MKDNGGEAISKLTEIIAKLEKKQSQVKRMLTNYKKQGCSSDPCTAYTWFQAHKELIIEEAPELVEWTGQIKELCDDILLQYDANFRDAVASEGWSIDGQWPKYYIERFIAVSIDSKKFTVTVGKEILKSLEMKKLIDVIKSYVKQFKPDPAKLRPFLEEMYAAYSAIRESEGGSVAIWDLYKQLVISRQSKNFWHNASRESFKTVRDVEFIAYLTELLKSNLTTISDHQMRLLPPLASSDSMFIYQPIEKRFSHVGRIQFLIIGGEDNAA